MEGILNYNCEILTVDYRFKQKLLSTETDFFENHCKNIRNIKSKKWGY
jgi:hypothetical protein